MNQITVKQKRDEYAEVTETIKKVLQFLDQFENYNEDDLRQLGGYAEKVLAVVKRLPPPRAMDGEPLNGDNYREFFERAADAAHDYSEFLEQLSLRFLGDGETAEGYELRERLIAEPETVFAELLDQYNTDLPRDVFVKIADDYNAKAIATKNQLAGFLTAFPTLGADANEYVKWRGDMLIRHKADLIRTMSRFEDDLSKIIYYTAVKTALLNYDDYTDEGNTSHALLQNLVTDKVNISAYDNTIFECYETDTVVEYPANSGDFILKYVENFPEPEKYIAYEPGKEPYTALGINVFKYDFQDFADCRDKGLSEAATVGEYVYYEETRFVQPETKYVALDEDYPDPVTFIKISDNSVSALLGAKEHIRRDKPNLSVSIWTDKYDLWKVVKTLDEIQEGYKLYLQYKGGVASLPYEITLLATFSK
ncbi:MAG: hypothetical protein LBN42_00035 [Oscillospiraceae bacterium]|jgi:hypothetical protein|nr:hypothetical protein [Oscillospiraceae bacterium]